MGTCSSPSDIQPADLGLPDKFAAWRPGQYAALLQTIESPKRFIGQCAPTGSGKSVLARAAGILMGGRTVILTSQKALQTQYGDDFPDLADLRGRQNYDCIEGGTCHDGRLSGCEHISEPDCPRMRARNTFISSKSCVTNYDCYFANVLHGEGVGEIDLLVLDEAHAAVNELSDALTIRLNHDANYTMYRDLGLTVPNIGTPLAVWRTWAQKTQPKVRSELTKLKQAGERGKRINLLDSFSITLTRLSDIPPDWIIDESVRDEISFAPLWPTAFAEEYLFRGIKKVLMISATIVPKTLELLGIKPSDADFFSQSYQFDKRRAPVYLFGGARIDHKTTEADKQDLVGRMDRIITNRLDRKGIIHTVSYDRQRYILDHSEHADLMIAPKGVALPEAVRLFKNADPPRILISPAVTTGYDFPMDECEYQIIVKVPFIDSRGPVMKARSEADPEYLPYITAQTLVQEIGRGMRGEFDQCENWLLDKHANWFLMPAKASSNGKHQGGYRHLFPRWFLDQLIYPSRGSGQPKPPPRLVSV